MKRLWLVIPAILVLAAAPIEAQRPSADVGRAEETAPRPEPPKPARAVKDAGYTSISPGEVQATPEMWFYEQAMREYKDPDMAVRRAAEYRAVQRQRRIESRKWFGLSNTRPQATPDPVNGDYAPCWTSNSPYYPSRWVGVGY